MAEGLGLKIFPGRAVASANLAEFFNAPKVSVAPAALDFGDQRTGSASAAETVTLTNTGTAALTLTSIAVAGDFARTTDCPLSPDALAAGAPCTISVTFTPAANGPRTGQLTVTAETPASPYIVDLTGTGISPVVSLFPTGLSFGEQLVGSTSAARTVTLSNAGSGPLNITSIAASSGFDESNNCGRSLDRGASCILSVTFAPTTAGNHTGTLTINDDAAGSPHKLSLSGMGTDFALVVAAGASASVTVTAGQTATYRLSLAPTGFSGTVTLACAGAPAKATCTISPASAGLDGTTTRKITVSVTTVAGGLGEPQARHDAPTASEPAGLTLTLWALVALWVTVMRQVVAGRKRLPIAPRWLTLGVALFVVLMGLACGGGSVVPPSRPGTPAGTYTLTVTAAGGAGSRSATLTLKVI